MMTETEVGEMQLETKEGQESTATTRSQEEGRKNSLSYKIPREHNHADTFQTYRFQISNFHVCVFKSFSLWPFVVADLEH